MERQQRNATCPAPTKIHPPKKTLRSAPTPCGRKRAGRRESISNIGAAPRRSLTVHRRPPRPPKRRYRRRSETVPAKPEEGRSILLFSDPRPMARRGTSRGERATARVGEAG